jgi:hypothetical protein
VPPATSAQLTAENEPLPVVAKLTVPWGEEAGPVAAESVTVAVHREAAPTATEAGAQETAVVDARGAGAPTPAPFGVPQPVGPS